MASSDLKADVVLIIGSGPAATEAQSWPRETFDKIVAINNAWQVRPDWTHLIFPDDFPEERQPVTCNSDQTIIRSATYVPAQNAFGGFVYAGGTMAFTAGYWALFAFRPRILAFVGCDMVYPAAGKTHFYGTGEADPLRPDPTLQSLEGKSARLGLLAARGGTACLNLSADESRLVFPRAQADDLQRPAILPSDASGACRDALRIEAELDYVVPSGKYWKEMDRFDAGRLAKLDQIWLDAYRSYLGAHQD